MGGSGDGAANDGSRDSEGETRHKEQNERKERYKKKKKKMFGWLGSCTSKMMTIDIDDFDDDPRGWSMDLAKYAKGQFSMAAVQGNEVMEDYCQVETSTNALFLGVYDGHRGIDASHYVSRNLFPNLLKRIPEIYHSNGDIPPPNILWQSVEDTEEGFMSVVRRGYQERAELASVGSCCLFCYLWMKGSILYISNLGDSRAVIGYHQQNRYDVFQTDLVAEQLTKDHNCNNEAIREPLRRVFRDDPDIFQYTRDAWRIKGISKLTRSIGDAHLKVLPFTRRDDFPRDQPVPGPFTKSVITTAPAVHLRDLRDTDRFLIVASHGLWEILSNQKVADIVDRKPRRGIAKRIIRKALKEMAKRKKIGYKALMGSDNRRDFHDDISVIVVYFDKPKEGQKSRSSAGPQEMSYRGFTEDVEPSDFRNFGSSVASTSSSAPAAAPPPVTDGTRGGTSRTTRAVPARRISPEP